MIRMDEFRREQKKREFKDNFVRKTREIGEVISNNSGLIITLTPIVVGGLTAVNRRHNIRKKEYIKNTYCYDTSLGHYWQLKRKLSAKEWLDIDRRKKGGERLSEILNSMNVLK